QVLKTRRRASVTSSEASKQRRPPRPSRFPYTTLFRSGAGFANDLDVERASAELERSRQAQADAVYSRAVAAARLEHLSGQGALRSEEHTSELQSRFDLVCRLLLDEKNGQLPAHPFGPV